MRDVTLQETDIRECYLDNAVLDGATITAAKTTDAVLPTAVEVGTRRGGLTGARLGTDGAPTWSAVITKLYSEACKHARAVGRTVGISPDDIASDFGVLVLASDRNRERIGAMKPGERRHCVQWVVGVIAQNLAMAQDQRTVFEGRGGRERPVVPEDAGVDAWELATYTERTREVTTSELRGRLISAGLDLEYLLDNVESEVQGVNVQEREWISRIYVDELLSYFKAGTVVEGWRIVEARYEEDLAFPISQSGREWKLGRYNGI